MLIYSAKFPVTPDFTKEIFRDMAIEWNQNSPFDKMENISWNDQETELKWQDDRKIFMIEDLTEYAVISSRFRKEDEHGVIWTTDFVLNYDQHILAVYLERETTQATTEFIPAFSPPYFVKLAIRRGYAAKDNNLDINDLPVNIKYENKFLIEDIILGKSQYILPIVYVTKTWEGKYPVNVQKMAQALQGVAHVLKETDPNISADLKRISNGENAHHGGVAIYFPNISAKCKKFSHLLYRDENGFKNKIVSTVFRYANQQIRENMYTWEGIQNERLRLKNQSLLNEHTKIANENEKLYSVFGNQLKEYEILIETLNKKNQALMLENQGLREKLDNMDEVPLLVHGEEEDFYEGEIREIILDILREYCKGKDISTRRIHVINDILQNNEFKNLPEKRKNQIKQILKGYKNMSGSMRKELEEFGFHITGDGKHYKLVYYGDNRYLATMAKTCSEYRSGNNLASEIAKKML